MKRKNFDFAEFKANQDKFISENYVDVSLYQNLKPLKALNTDIKIFVVYDNGNFLKKITVDSFRKLYDSVLHIKDSLSKKGFVFDVYFDFLDSCVFISDIADLSYHFKKQGTEFKLSLEGTTLVQYAPES